MRANRTPITSLSANDRLFELNCFRFFLVFLWWAGEYPGGGYLRSGGPQSAPLGRR